MDAPTIPLKQGIASKVNFWSIFSQDSRNAYTSNYINGYMKDIIILWYFENKEFYFAKDSVNLKISFSGLFPSSVPKIFTCKRFRGFQLRRHKNTQKTDAIEMVKKLKIYWCKSREVEHRFIKEASYVTVAKSFEKVFMVGFHKYPVHPHLKSYISRFCKFTTERL